MSKEHVRDAEVYVVVVEDRENLIITTEVFADVEDAWKFILDDVKGTYGLDFEDVNSRDEMDFNPYKFLNLKETPVFYTVEPKLIIK